MANIGELAQTRKGWIVVPPKHCHDGHDLAPHQVLVGHMPCGGPFRGGYSTWRCLECDDGVYAPALSEQRRLVHGAAQNRGV